jgi:hypothetical protein
MYSILATMTLAGILLHVAFDRQPRTVKRLAELILLYLLAIMVGVNGIVAFGVHVYIADQVSLLVGLAPASPFQFEIAVANLAFGVLGLLCVLIRGHFWTAVVIGQSIFYWAAAYGTINRAAQAHGQFSGDTMSSIAMDIGVPIIMIALLIAYRKAPAKE